MNDDDDGLRRSVGRTAERENDEGNARADVFFTLHNFATSFEGMAEEMCVFKKSGRRRLA